VIVAGKQGIDCLARHVIRLVLLLTFCANLRILQNRRDGKANLLS